MAEDPWAGFEDIGPAVSTQEAPKQDEWAGFEDVGEVSTPKKISGKKIYQQTDYELARDFSADPEQQKIYREEMDKVNPVTKALAAVPQGIGFAARDIQSVAARLAGLGDSADSLNRDQQNIEASVSQDFVPRTLRGATRSILPAVVIGRLGGGTAGMAAFSGANQANQSYTEAKDAGHSPLAAAGIAAVQGGIEAGGTLAFNKIGEKLGLGSGVEGMLAGQITSSPTVRSALMKYLASTFGQELPEEASIAFAQAAFNKIAKVDPNQTFTLEEIGNVFLDTVAQTAVAGGFAAAPDALGAATGRNLRTNPGEAPPIIAPQAPGRSQAQPAANEPAETPESSPEPVAAPESKPQAQPEPANPRSVVEDALRRYSEGDQNQASREKLHDDIADIIDSPDIDPQTKDAVNGYIFGNRSRSSAAALLNSILGGQSSSSIPETPEGSQSEETNPSEIPNSSVEFSDSPPPGMTRLYHGGNNDPTARKAWVSVHKPYAEGYARKNGGQLYYVDVPTDSLPWDDNGMPDRPSQWVLPNMEIDTSLTKGMKIHPDQTQVVNESQTEQQPAEDVSPAGETVVATDERNVQHGQEIGEEVGQGRQGLLGPGDSQAVAEQQSQPNATATPAGVEAKPSPAGAVDPVEDASQVAQQPAKVILQGAKSVTVGPLNENSTQADQPAQEVVPDPQAETVATPRLTADEIAVKAYKSTRLANGIAKKTGVPQDEWEDVMQKATIKAAQNADSFDPEKGQFNTWFGNIVSSVAIDHQKEKTAQKRQDANAPTKSLGENDDKADINDVAEYVVDTVDKLDPQTAEWVKAILTTDATFDELAEQAGTSPEAVRIAVEGAVESLRSEYDQKATPRKSKAPPAPKPEPNRGAFDKFFSDILKRAPGLSQAKIEAASKLMQSWLTGYIGVNPDDWVAANVTVTDSPVNDESLIQKHRDAINAAVSFTEDGKALLHVFETANASTIPHELAHIMRRHLKPEDQQVANDFVSAKDSNWTRDQEEKFSRAWESFLYKPKAKGRFGKKLMEVFASMRNWLLGIYKGIVDSPLKQKLTPEIEAVFEKLLGGPTKASLDKAAKVKRAAKGIRNLMGHATARKNMESLALQADRAFRPQFNTSPAPTSGPKHSWGSIIKAIDNLFDIPMRVGKTGKALGRYFVRPEVVRLLQTAFGNPAVVAHEVAHHIDNKTDVLNSISHSEGLQIEDIISKAQRSPQNMKSYLARAEALGASQELRDALKARQWAHAAVLSAREFGVDTAEKRAVRVELRNLDYRVKYGNLPAKDGMLEEGFAEFMRITMANSDPNQSVAGARNITKMYGDWLAKNPDMSRRIDKATELIRGYRGMSPLERGAVEIKTRQQGRDEVAADGILPDNPERAISWLDMIWSRIGDRLHIARKITSEAVAKGLKLAPGSAWLTDVIQFGLGKSQIISDKDFSEGVTLLSDENYGKVIGPGIGKYLKSLAWDTNKQSEALVWGRAMMTVEAEAKSPEYDTGMDVEDALAVLNEASKDPAKVREFAEFFRRLREYDNDLIRKKIDVGIMTQENLQDMTSGWSFYMPLVRILDSKGAFKGSRRGMADTASSGMFKRTEKGSDAPVQHVLQTMMERTLATNSQVMNWKMVDNLAKTIDPNRGGAHGMGRYFERIEGKALVQVIKTRLKDNFDQLRSIAQKLGASEQTIDDLANDPRAQDEVLMIYLQNRKPDPRNGLYVHVETEFFNPKTGEIKKLDKPRLVAYKFYDPHLFEYLESLSPQQMGAFFKFFKSITSLIQGGITTFSGQFLMHNRFFHDPGAAIERTKYQSPLAVHLNSFAADAAIIGNDFNGKRNKLVDLFREDVGRVSKQVGSITDTELSVDHYSGVMEANAVAKMTPQQKADYEKQKPKKPFHQRTYNTLRHLNEKVGAIAAYAEDGIRFAEYLAAMRHHGYDVDSQGEIVNLRTGQRELPPYAVRLAAGNAGKNITTDFQLSGDIAQKIGTIIPFFGAQITGFAQSWRNRAIQGESVIKIMRGDRELSQHDKEQAQRFLIGTSVNMLQGAMFAALANALWPEEYFNEAGWLNWMTFRIPGVSGGPILSINKGRSSLLAVNAGEALFNAGVFMATGNQDAARRGSGLVGTALWNEMISPDSPWFLPFELMGNKFIGFRHGQPIEWDGVGAKLPKDRYRDSTTPLGMAIGKGMGAVTDYGVSPIAADHIGDTVTGGTWSRWQRPFQRAYGGAQQVLQTGDPASMLGGRGFTTRDIPFAGKVLGSQNYYDSPDIARQQLDLVSKKIQSAKFNKEPTQELKKEKWRLDAADDISRELRELMRGESDNQKKAVLERLVVGASNFAIGRTNSESFPNPLSLPGNVPADVKDIIRTKMSKLVDAASYDLSTESKQGKKSDDDESIIAGRENLRAILSPEQIKGLLRDRMTERGLKKLNHANYRHKLKNWGLEP